MVLIVNIYILPENVNPSKEIPDKGGISWKIITATTSCFTALLIVIVFLIIRRRRPKGGTINFNKVCHD